MEYKQTNGVRGDSDSENAQSEDEQDMFTSENKQIHRIHNLQFKALSVLTRPNGYMLCQRRLMQKIRLLKRTLQGPVNHGGNTISIHPNTKPTLAGLVAAHDVNSGGLDPRAYQIELFERAKARNIIAVLDTGMFREYKALGGN